MDLLVASKFGYHEEVKELLDSGIDPDTITDECGDGPLYLAITHDNLITARLLLDHGANPTLQDDEYNAPSQVTEDPERKELLKLAELAWNPQTWTLELYHLLPRKRRLETISLLSALKLKLPREIQYEILKY